MGTGDVVLVDVRPAQEYAAGHIDGAQLIPLEATPGSLGGAAVHSDASGFPSFGSPLCIAGKG